MALLSQAVPRKIIYEPQYQKYDIKIKIVLLSQATLLRMNKLIKFKLTKYLLLLCQS